MYIFIVAESEEYVNEFDKISYDSTKISSHREF